MSAEKSPDEPASRRGGERSTHSTSPVDRLLDALKQANCDPKRSGSGWSARCPAHDDRNPSLSVGVGDDGRALVHCMAGCEMSAVLRSLGMTQAELFAKSNGKVPRRSPAKRAVKRAAPKKKPKSWPTLSDALAERKPDAKWAYENASGEVVGYALRLNQPGGKIFLPLRRFPGGWEEKGMDEPRPLYHLMTVLGSPAETLCIMEGEKCVDIADSVGLLATTSVGGSKAAAKTDWSHLRGRDVVIFPDKGDAGEHYARQVARLALEAGARSVKIVRFAEVWPEMPENGDLCDMIGEEGPWASRSNEDIRAAIETLIEQAEPIESDESDKPEAPLPYKPFPTDALPEPMRALVIEGAKAMGCDPSMIALPALAVTGTAIGGSRALQVKPGWIARPTIWACVIARSGTAKSPAMKLAIKPLRRVQSIAFGVFDEAMKEHQVKAKQHKATNRAWEQSGGDGFPPIEPVAPTCDRCIVSDATLEALAPILQENPRGVLVVRDELGGWLKSFGEYKSGRGGDVEAWLSIYDSESIVIDRKTGRETINVEAPHVSICGTIQPGALVRALGDANIENGLAGRLLMARPPAKMKKFSEAIVSEATTGAWAKSIGNLLALDAGEDDDGNPTPIVMTMTPEAKRVWIELDGELVDAFNIADDPLGAALSKLKVYSVRLALIVHLVNEAGLGAALATPTPISVEAMESACALVRWFTHEAERIYSTFSETEPQRERRELVELIGRLGGRVSPNDLRASNVHRWPTSAEAEAAMQELVNAGYGHWEYPKPSPKGGRPSKVFVLTKGETETNTPAGGAVAGGLGFGIGDSENGEARSDTHG